MSRFDVVVSGAGVSGAVAAIGLARAGLQVALIERQLPVDSSLAANTRVVALAPSSASILQRLDLWPLPNTSACAYTSMQVEAEQHRLQFDAASLGTAALGWITDLEALQQRCWLALSPAVRVIAPARIERVDRSRDGLRIDLDDGQRLRARLLLIAEGANSTLRETLGFQISRRDYAASGIVARVHTEQTNPGIAFQRFGQGGPLALLPLEDGSSSIVWTRPDADVARWMQSGDDELAAALTEASASRFGAITSMATRSAFPLRMLIADRFTQERVALIGDSAHVVHPLAGLGLNLGLLDVAALIDVVAKAHSQGRDIGGAGTLARYASWREGDNRMAAGLIDVIERTFGGGPSAFQSLAERAIGAVDALPLLKRFFSVQAAGWGGRVPTLAAPL